MKEGFGNLAPNPRKARDAQSDESVGCAKPAVGQTYGDHIIVLDDQDGALALRGSPSSLGSRARSGVRLRLDTMLALLHASIRADC